MEITTKENEITSISEPARNSLISNNINPEELMKHYNGIELSNNPDVELYCNIIRKNNRVKRGRLTLDGETIREFQSKRNFKEVTLKIGNLKPNEILEIVNDFHSKLQKENKGDICATYAVMVGQWLGYELKNSESKENVGVDACELPYTLIEDGYENMGKNLSSQELDKLPDGSMILIRNERSRHLGKFENKVKMHVGNMSEEDKQFPTHVVVKINGKWHESRAGRLVESTSEKLLNERNSNSHITHIMKPKENTKKHKIITIKQTCTPLSSAGDALNNSRKDEGFSGVAASGNYYNEKNYALSNIIETKKLLVLLEKIKEENKIATLSSIPTQS